MSFTCIQLILKFLLKIYSAVISLISVLESILNTNL